MIEVGNYRYTNQDARNTLIHAGDLFDLLERGHSSATIAAQRASLAAALAARLGESPGLGLADPGLGELGALAAKSFGLPGWEPKAVEAVLGELHTQWESAAAALRASGEFPAEAFGTVAQLNTSGGGVPKRPRDHVDVTYQGVRGDAQTSRQHHGRPWQALCIWNVESIEALQTEGHPIFAGAAGENITIVGIEWPTVRPGTRLLIGNVLAEIWAYAVPCTQQSGWFTDGRFRRLHHDQGDISRVYARVLQTGRIATGDEVVLEPSSTRPRQRQLPVQDIPAAVMSTETPSVEDTLLAKSAGQHQ